MADTKVESKLDPKSALQALNPQAPKPAIVAPVAKSAVKNPAPERGWYYHKVSEPKIIEKGDEISEGWHDKNIFGWYKDVKNNFHWRRK